MDLIEINENNINRHPWEISRCSSILKLLKGNPRDACYADIGAGDLFFTKKLVNYTDNVIYAVDAGYESYNKIGQIEQLNTINDIPRKSVDIIMLMDVLEHIEDEDKFLDSVLSLLRNSGKIILTVPAHKFLFCSHDVFLGHYRRYDINKLTDFLKRRNLEIQGKYYFYTTLFFMRCLEVLLSKIKLRREEAKRVSRWKRSQYDAITRIIVFILNLDFDINRLLQKIGITLTGLSICVICQKKSV